MGVVILSGLPKYVGGYLVERIVTHNGTIVLFGYNPHAAQPYGRWEYAPETGPVHGTYWGSTYASFSN